MAAFSALIGGSFTFGALAGPHIAPIALNSARFWLAAIIMGVLAAAGGRIRWGLPPAPWRFPLLAALYAGYFVLMFEALRTAPPVGLSAIFTLTPLLTGIIGWWLLRQQMTGRMTLAIAIGAIGALWVVFEGDWRAMAALRIGKGEIIYFIGVVAHALYSPAVRRLSRGEPALAFTFGVLFCSALLCTAVGLPAILATDWANLPPVVWAAILYTAIFTTAVTVFILQIASLRLPAAKVMAHTYLVPAWVILWELAFGRTPPPPLVLIGLVLSVVALILLLRDEDRVGEAG